MPFTALADEDEPFQWGFVVGRYQFIGRLPDGQSTYTGTASIERVGDTLRLTRTKDGRQSQVFGVIRPADPGESLVLAFHWQETQPLEMVCLIGSDLDNYARLTCHWGPQGKSPTQPGMEAYFAQEPWDPVRP